MIYDSTAKQEYCQRNGVPFASVAFLPYEQWTALRFAEALRRGESWALTVKAGSCESA